MKQILFLFFFAISFGSQAQLFVHKVNINELEIQYLEVWERYDGDKEKFFAMVDYGQKYDPTDLDGTKLRMKNEKGRSLKFNGIMDILNFMAKNGWEVIHVRPIGKIETSFVMKKKTNAPEFITQIKNEIKPIQVKKEVKTEVANKEVIKKEIVKENAIKKVDVKTIKEK